jgi:hypothetical protein
MQLETSRPVAPPFAVAPSAAVGGSHEPDTRHDVALERAVEYVLDECFFTVGQVVGTRKALEYDAVVWWREHYRARFLGAMERFGNRWQQDRHHVKAVAFMLAERATRYASDADAIGVDAARQAAADVERYCTLHSRRAARANRGAEGDDMVPRLAGYWCVDTPPSP